MRGKEKALKHHQTSDKLGAFVVQQPRQQLALVVRESPTALDKYYFTPTVTNAHALHPSMLSCFIKEQSLEMLIQISHPETCITPALDQNPIN